MALFAPPVLIKGFGVADLSSAVHAVIRLPAYRPFGDGQRSAPHWRLLPVTRQFLVGAGNARGLLASALGMGGLSACSLSRFFRGHTLFSFTNV